MPPLIAILLALIFRQVLLALFAGVFTGALIIHGYDPVSGFFLGVSDYIGLSAANPDNFAILVFSLTLGGMVGVISRAGGTQGIVEALSRYASGYRRGQLATWAMGILIFFDDYANTLIVGNTMRPFTDKLKISREKLAYLVDSTAAPITTIALISTWIGYQISLIGQAYSQLGLQENAYLVFLKTIPYSFYPIMALVFAFFIAILGRDFGPMLAAERRAQHKGKLLGDKAIPLADVNARELLAEPGTPLRWYNALVPILTVILTTIAGLWITGYQKVGPMAGNDSLMHYISTVFGAGDSFKVLLWSAFLGTFVAIIMILSQKILSLHDALNAWVAGVKSLVLAALILVMAWSIGNVCNDVQTANWVINSTQSLLSARWVPAITFVVAGVIAFSTGSSWATMAILTPIVIPIAHQLPAADPGITAAHQQIIMLSSIAAVLAGSVFGDHCSPISDTTIMSSMASGSDHIDHVRTQMPYALVVAFVAMLFGFIPAGFGLTSGVEIVLGVVVMFIIVRFVGKRSTEKTA
ncbi:MAG TPA: Na+/H+ antiporter NhaC family protein [Caldithrix abyssi]|uniref:Na+/H+ antiporter NhaC family protein n=1 Tax=Caldithrix abyssi TaxID=187145 RepID=A0A7V5RPX5_CALAY|nr:Na+/H+ antiporter NhaC family protein [Caldithrix abyssi]